MGSRRLLASSILAFIAFGLAADGSDVPAHTGHQGTSASVGTSTHAAKSATVEPANARNKPAHMASIGTPPTTAKEHLPALRHSGVRNTADHTITEHMRVEKKDVKTDSNMKTAYYYGGNNYNYGGNNYGGNNYGGNNYNYGGNNYNYGGSYYSSYSDRYCSYWSYGSEYSSYCGYLDYQPSCCGSSCCAQGYDYCTSNNECSMYDNSYNDYYCEGTYCGYLDHQPSCCGITCCADGYDYCNEYNECAMASTYDSRYCEGTYCGYLDHQPTCCGANCCAVGYDYCNEYNECSTSSTYDNRYCDGTYCGYLAYQPSCCGGTCCSEGYNYCNEYNECSMSSTYDYRYCEGSYCGYLAYQPSCCGSACCAEGYNFCNQYNECAMRTYEYRYCEGSYCGFLDYQPGCCGNICCSTDTAWCNEHNECVEGYYFPTMQPTRMSRDATEKMRRKIGKSASDNALAKTMHKSGVFVANAIRSAGLDFPERYDVQPGEFGPLMQGAGFVEISKLYKRMDGDVAVWSVSNKHKHGHVQVYFNDKWFSDFAQERLSPWYDSRGSTVTYYRYGSV
jgi:hypothetical protein